MSNRMGLALGLAAAGLLLVTMSACGGDDDDDGTGGNAPGGTGGIGGTGGGGTGGGGTGGGGTGGGGTGGTSGGGTGGGGTGGGGTGGGGTGGGGTGGGGTGGGGTGGGGTGGGGTGGGGTGGGDTDNSCGEATDLSSTGEGTGSIDPDDDVDFYSFPFTEGDWVILRASTTVPAGVELDEQAYEDILDTVISVYDETGNTLVASMDDSYPRISTNSELVWRVPATGTYCIKVEDWASWAGEARPVAPTGLYWDYEVGVYSPESADGTVIDVEPNDDETAPQPHSLVELDDENGDPSGDFAGWTFGTLSTATDVDVFSFTLPAGTVSLSTEDFTMPTGPGGAGTNGNGSTLTMGLVSVSDTAGNIIAQLDTTLGSDAMTVPLTAGTDYLLWVTRDVGSMAGGNDFYNLINFVANADNPAEAETVAGANDAAADAEAVTLTASTSDPNTDSGYVLGFIQGAGDVDYYSFTVAAGDKINLACGAIRSGSGLTAPVFAVYDSGDTELQSETETDTADIFWSDTTYGIESNPAVTVATAGTYYLVVSAGGQNPDVSGNYYRCGIHVETP